MSDKTITELAEEISFRLLATKKHDDFDWLVEQLTEYIEEIREHDFKIFHEGEDPYEQVKVIKEMEDLLKALPKDEHNEK